MYDFHVTPKTEEELSDLLPEGEYQFQIIESKAAERNGYPQMIWTLKLWDSNGRTRAFVDFFKVDPASNFCMRKIRHALYCIGMGELWERGKWSAADFNGKTGTLSMIRQPAGTGKDGKYYEARNNIKDYIMDRSDLHEATKALAERRSGGDLPPVDAYSDIPGFN